MLRPVCFLSMELLSFPSRLFAPKMLDHPLYYFVHMSFIPIHASFVSERSGRDRCTGIQQQQYSSSMYEYLCCR